MSAVRLQWSLACAALIFTATCSAAYLDDRRHILIVGSSTAYPIVTAAAEQIARRRNMTTPVVESTGTGGGIKMFCSGTGLNTPDIVMASRRMKDSEREACFNNQVNDIREVRIGYDGIVIAGGKDTPPFTLTKRILYLAIARQVPSAQDPARLIANPYQTWQQIEARLPDIPIRLLGPPPTSGTRDILVERVLEDACLGFPVLRALKSEDQTAFANSCHALREDGAFVNSGENDARMVRKLITDTGALGVLGYSFLDRNRARLNAATIDGVAPAFESIESGVYPLSRPLYLYIKPQHERLVGELDTFVRTLLSRDITGPEGYLVDRGLIPLTERDRATAETREAARQ